MATDSFDQMAPCLFASNWRKLPIELQKCYVILIANAQRPVYYHGCSVIILNFETFSNVSYSLHSKDSAELQVIESKTSKWQKWGF